MNSSDEHSQTQLRVCYECIRYLSFSVSREKKTSPHLFKMHALQAFSVQRLGSFEKGMYACSSAKLLPVQF